MPKGFTLCEPPEPFLFYFSLELRVLAKVPKLGLVRLWGENYESQLWLGFPKVGSIKRWTELLW